MTEDLHGGGTNYIYAKRIVAIFPRRRRDHPIRQNDRFVLSIPLNEWALGAAAAKLG